MNTNRPVGTEDTEVAELPEALSGELLILKAAYRAAEQRDAEPSPEIDDALRAAARRAVNAGPGEVPLTRSFFHFPTLATPLAAAAVIVLAVSVGFLSMEEPFMRRHLKPEPPMAVSVVRPQSDAAQASAETSTAGRVDAAKPAPVTPVGATNSTPAPASAASRGDGPGDRAAVPSAKSAAAAPAAKAPAAPPAPVALKESPAQAERALSASAPAPAEPAPVVARAVAAPPPPAPPAPQAPVSAAPPNRDIVLADANDPRLKGLAKRERYEQPTAPAAVPPAAAPAPAPLPEARVSPGNTSGARAMEAATLPTPVTTQGTNQNAAIKDSAAQSKRDVPVAATSAAPLVRPAPLAKPAEPALYFDEANPKTWLEGIVRLKTAGNDKQAAEQLKRFRERYPDHALPEVLQEKK